MKVSLLLSIHNRSKLFAMGLASLAQQRFDRRDWEILVIDDQSTEDLAAVYGPYIGQFNIRHIRIDHKRHHIYKELNPVPRDPPKWWHTPALSINIGIRQAQGEVLWITQPEVLQDPMNLYLGYEAARSGPCFAFVDMWNDHSGRVRDDLIARNAWPPPEGGMQVRQIVQHYLEHLQRERPAMFWFSAFCRRDVAIAVEGVRELYLRGAAAEDDDFRDRLALAGFPPYLLPEACGVHLFHGDEKEFHHRRDHEHWQEGLRHNRSFYFTWRDHPGREARAREQERNWGHAECIEWERSYGIN